MIGEVSRSEDRCVFAEVLLTLGNECRVTRDTVRNAKNQPLSGTDAPKVRYRRIRVWNGNYLEGTVLVKKVRSGKIYSSGPNDLAIIGNANQNGKRGMRIIQRCPLTFVKNEAVNHAINAFIYSNHKAVVVDTVGLRFTRHRAGKV